jgi:four helix bundle protein
MEKGSTIKSFRDLRVWQASKDLVEQAYLTTQEFPKHEMDGLAAQLQRAAVSIPANIAEDTRELTAKNIHVISSSISRGVTDTTRDCQAPQILFS